LRSIRPISSNSYYPSASVPGLRGPRGVIPEGVLDTITDSSTSGDYILKKIYQRSWLSWFNHLMRDGKFVSKQHSKESTCFGPCWTQTGSGHWEFHREVERRSKAYNQLVSTVQKWIVENTLVGKGQEEIPDRRNRYFASVRVVVLLSPEA
jgi:hypothetical protein